VAGGHGTAVKHGVISWRLKKQETSVLGGAVQEWRGGTLPAAGILGDWEEGERRKKGLKCFMRACRRDGGGLGGRRVIGTSGERDESLRLVGRESHGGAGSPR